jgi:opacity protein-like surface antigen
MRAFMIAATVTALAAAPLFAQDRTGQHQAWQDAGGYVTGMGGFTTVTGNTTSDLLIEGGVRVVPHVMVFGNVGQFHNLQADLQPTLNTATTALATNQGLTVLGGGTLPAWYSIGGARVEVPTSRAVLPYVLGGIGVARLNPSPQFTFSSGTMPDGSTPTAGQDVTSLITSSGAYTAPPSSTTFMFTLGGGVQFSVASRWVADAGYRYSRLAADSTLNTLPLNANGMTFGVGYRF